MGRLEIKPPNYNPAYDPSYLYEESEKNIYARFLPRTISVMPAAMRSASWSPTDS